MLVKLFPRAHVRFSRLPLLGPHLDEFAMWLHLQGYPPLPIRMRVRAAKRLAALLRRKRVRSINDLTAAKLLSFAPNDSQNDIPLAAVVRSLTQYFQGKDAFAKPPRATVSQSLIASYRMYLDELRGFAASTINHHVATASEFVTFMGYDPDAEHPKVPNRHSIERFVLALGKRLRRESLQHAVAHLRSFLRFLATRGLAPTGLDNQIDTPRVYRSERLPRTLPWATVQALLNKIDRSTSMGRRDYAMLLLVATYGLRCCEVVELKLEDIGWRTGRLSVQQRKVRARLILPLTSDVGDAIIAYLRDGRPQLPYREIFLRERAPAGTLKATALTEAFQGWVRRSGLPIPYQGPHCLRHSLAVQLLRQGSSIKAIGDLFGHRSTESTCVYLRLHVDDLRDVAIDLPANCGEEEQR